MKKTLILTCALAAVTQAATSPLTLSSTFENRTLVTTIGENTIVSSITTTATLLTGGAVAGDATHYVPNVNLGANAANSWTATLSYTLPSDVTSFTLQTIGISGVGCNSGGDKQTAAAGSKGVQYAVTLRSGEQSYDLGTATWGNYTMDTLADGMTFDASTITLATPVELTRNFTLEITATRNTAGGCFYGLDSISLAGTTDVVPEPATATLSLLALAGLAARRRRK